AAGSRDHGESSVGSRQDRGRRVDIARLDEEVFALVAAGRVHLLDFLPGDPPDRVEVVDAAIAEDSARPRDVGRRWWSRVERRRAHRVQPAQLPGRDGGTSGNESLVEATW